MLSHYIWEITEDEDDAETCSGGLQLVKTQAKLQKSIKKLEETQLQMCNAVLEMAKRQTDFERSF